MEWLKGFLFFVSLIFYVLSIGYTGVYGELTKIENFPSQVTIETDRRPSCGGAIIGDQWILTARSCIPQNVTEVNRVRVRAGTSVLGRGGAFHTVSKMVKYSGIKSMFGVKDADLGLIKINSPFTYTSALRWSAPNVDPLPEDEDIEISGWSIHNETADKFLQKALVKLIPHDQCIQLFENRLNITESMSCLVPSSEEDNGCVADVGAPISVRGLTTAVVSNNEYCWNEGLPLVVTSIKSAGWFIVFVVSEPLLRYGYQF